MGPSAFHRSVVLVADDHPLVHQSIGALLEGTSRNIDVRCALDADSLWKACLEGPLFLVLIDLRMPGMTRRGGISGFQHDFPDQPAALLTGAVSDSERERFRAAGGRGILLKSWATRDLLAGLNKLLDGAIFFPEAGVRTAHESGQGPGELRLDKLSPRLREVYDLLLLGLSNREIAQRLGLSVGTVKNYLHETYRTLDVTSRAKVLHGALSARHGEAP